VYFIYISVSLSEIDETIKCIFKFKIILDYMEVSGRAIIISRETSHTTFKYKAPNYLHPCFSIDTAIVKEGMKSGIKVDPCFSA
jgi:hypothetical protein